MRSFIMLAVVLGCSGPAAPADAHPSRVQVYESHEAHITEGETTLATDPDTAFRASVDYARWGAIFPEIRQTIVTEQHGDDARVSFIYADHRDNVHFHNRPAERVVWLEDTGGRAQVWAEIRFSPGMIAGTTLVHSRVFADVHGVASLFVTDAKIRALRGERVRGDLDALHGYFASAAVAQASADGGLR